MADVNFGILQSPEQLAPIRGSMGAQVQASAPQAQTQGLSDLGSGLAQVQQMQNEKVRTGLLQNEDARAAALQPGILQAQSDAHARAQAEVAANQFAIQVRQKTAQAFIDGQAKGGTEGGLDAQQQKMMELGDTAGALAQAKTREDLKKQIAENNQNGVAALGSAIANIVSSAQPPIPPTPSAAGVPAQPGHPGITGLDLYTQQYPQLKKMYPDAPAPSTFKDDGQFHDAFVAPILATAGPIAKQKQLDMEALKEDALHKANLNATAAQEAVTKAINTYGASSQQALDAATTLSQAQGNARRVAVGGGIGAGVSSHLPVALGGLESPQDIIKRNMPNTSIMNSDKLPTPPATKTIGNVTYVQHNGQWFQQ